MYVSFSVYVPVVQEKQGSQERAVHAVLSCQFFLRATRECLGVDFCAHAYPAQGKGSEGSVWEGEACRLPVLVVAACCSQLVIFSTTAPSHCLILHIFSPGRVEAKTLLGKLGTTCH